MLSIGKLAAGQAKYYLDQAEARVDVVQSVGSGVEDYYVGPSEARGRWIGAAARELGLGGEVTADALRRVLEGLDPRDRSELRASSSRARVAGFDLTFSAVTNGQRGEVVAVDREAGSLTLACGGRRVELDRAFLAGVTRDGDPTLLHGYAMTGDVAQGATVDPCFVLASDGMSREWAYVALSRGRLSNRLYVAAQPDDARAEFAPVQPEQRDPVERLAAALRVSDGQVLAIDSGAAVPSDVRIAAQRDADDATKERRDLERRRHQWLPGRRGELAEARGREEAAAARLKEMRRAEVELRHGTRQFVTERELEARRDVTLARIADHGTERVLQRGRQIGREL